MMTLTLVEVADVGVIDVDVVELLDAVRRALHVHRGESRTGPAANDDSRRQSFAIDAHVFVTAEAIEHYGQLTSGPS